MEERQTNYTIAEGYDLPSKGLIYEKPINPHVELRSMTARDEMKRLSPSTTPLKTLADIIEGCMVEKPDIHVYDMCVGDYEYLLHKLRIVTYGPEYAVDVQCPYCGTVTSTTMNLEDLELKEFDIEEINNLKTFTLPRSKKLITLNIQTPRMIDEIDIKSKELRRKHKEANIDFETLLKLTLSIKSIDDQIPSPIELDKFINELPAIDMQKILINIDKLNSAIGLDTAFYVPCNHCNEEVKTFFRFGTEFFRPTNI